MLKTHAGHRAKRMGVLCYPDYWGLVFFCFFYFHGFSYYFKSGLGWDISFSATAQCISETSIAHYILIINFTFVLNSEKNRDLGTFMSYTE